MKKMLQWFTKHSGKIAMTSLSIGFAVLVTILFTPISPLISPILYSIGIAVYFIGFLALGAWFGRCIRTYCDDDKFCEEKYDESSNNCYGSWGKKFLSQRSCDDKVSLRIKEDYESYQLIANDIMSDLYEINQKYSYLSQQIDIKSENYRVKNTFFSQQSNSYNACSREDSERKELSARLGELFNSYPLLDEKYLDDPGYILMMQKDLENHHAIVKLVFQRYYEVVQVLCNLHEERNNSLWFEP